MYFDCIVTRAPNRQKMKPSKFINSKQVREILRAGRHAWRVERGLNYYIVINFNHDENDELKAQRNFRNIRKKCISWLYYKRKNDAVSPLTDIRTWENRIENIHVNWALHVPEKYEAEFLKKIPVWIKKELGLIDDGRYHIKKTYNVNGLLRYMLKGVDPSKGYRFEIRPLNQGKVWGRRAVASTCLGKMARKRDFSEGRVKENIKNNTE